MQRTLSIISAMLAVFGAIIALQGAGVVPGSRMTGDRHWLVVGSVMVVLGLIGFYRAHFRRRR